MKLGAAWYGFGDQTATNYFEMAASLGLKYVEVPLYSFSLDDWYGTRESVGAVRDAALEAGVKIVSGVAALNIAGHIVDGEIDTDGVDLGRAQARRVIEIAAVLGLEVVRLAEPQRVPPEHQALVAPYLQAYGDAFRALGDYAAERGLRIAIENFGLEPDQINEVLDAANHPAVGTLYDPCNYYRHGHDPLAALKKLRQRVYYCHLKDAYFPYPARQLQNPPMLYNGQTRRWWWIRPLGEGKIDWGPILSELATFYDGYVCLEHDIRDDVMHGTRIGIACIRRLARERSLDIEL